jgi:hypothetical protein
MHQGEIKLGKVEGVKAYNVEISSAAIELGYDANATKGNSHFFSVTNTGAMTLYHPDSIIELG